MTDRAGQAPRTRVLQVINSLGEGGAERSLAESIAPLRDRGIDIEIATLAHRQDGVEAVVHAAGARVHRCSPGRLSCVRSLRRLINDRKIDLAHTTLFDADVAGRLAAAGTRVPVLTSLVNMSYEPIRFRDPAIRPARLRAVQAVDAVTGLALTRHFHAITETVADAAHRRLRVPRRKITVIPRGRDESRLGHSSPERRAQVRRRLGLAPEIPVLLCVGRHEYQKGLVDAIDAMAEVMRTHPDTVMILAGREGNSSESIRQRIADHGVEDSVRVLGHVDDVPDLMVASDALVFPSLFEGLGGTLIEAMGLELPIVTTDLPVTREVAGDAALFVPPGAGASIADAARQVLGDQEQSARMRADGRARFESTYRLEAVQDRMAELYRSVASG